MGNMKLARKKKIGTTTAKKTKIIFVIMPFSLTPTRNKAQLTAFFENEIKRPIESGRFEHNYEVRRSDDTFNITEQIVKDLYSADIVICDLSGPDSNPNVMYELGIRLAFSNKPVILIREAHKDNKPIFDIGGFYAESYDPFAYAPLREHIATKLKNLETGKETYLSPVLKIVGQDQPLLVQMSARRAASLLDTLSQALAMNLRMLGGHIHSYLMSLRPKIDLGKEDIIDFFLEMGKRAGTLNKVDWSRFHYAPGSQPTLDYYLATRYLHAIIDPDIEELFTRLLLVFHGRFMAADTMTTRWTPGTIHGFYQDTLLIRSSVLRLGFVLVSKDMAKIENAKNEMRTVIVQRLKEG